MKIRTYQIPKEADDLEELLNDDKYDVKKMLLYGKDNSWLLVIYKAKEERLAQEEAHLEQVKEVAESIRKDQAYSELKNANQRCLYLLDRYHIPKSVALDVIDEVKVQEITEKVAFT